MIHIVVVAELMIHKHFDNLRNSHVNVSNI